MITIDEILNNLETLVKERKPIGAHIWLESAQRLTVLLGDEHARLYLLMQLVARMKLDFLENSKSVAEAKIKVEATDEYREMKLQEAKIRRVEEMARIAKKQATLSDTELRLQ